MSLTLSTVDTLINAISSLIIVNGKLMESNFNHEDISNIKIKSYSNDNFTKKEETNSLIYLNGGCLLINGNDQGILAKAIQKKGVGTRIYLS